MISLIHTISKNNAIAFPQSSYSQQYLPPKTMSFQQTLEQYGGCARSNITVSSRHNQYMRVQKKSEQHSSDNNAYADMKKTNTVGAEVARKKNTYASSEARRDNNQFETTGKNNAQAENATDSAQTNASNKQKSVETTGAVDKKGGDVRATDAKNAGKNKKNTRHQLPDTHASDKYIASDESTHTNHERDAANLQRHGMERLVSEHGHKNTGKHSKKSIEKAVENKIEHGLHNQIGKHTNEAPKISQSAEYSHMLKNIEQHPDGQSVRGGENNSNANIQAKNELSDSSVALQGRENRPRHMKNHEARIRGAEKNTDTTHSTADIPGAHKTGDAPIHKNTDESFSPSKSFEHFMGVEDRMNHASFDAQFTASMRGRLSSKARTALVNLKNGGNDALVHDAKLMLRSHGGGQVRLQLNPKELGDVTLVVKLDETNMIHAKAMVSSDEAKDVMQKNLGELAKQFGAEGYQIGSFSVSVNSDTSDNFNNRDEKNLAGIHASRYDLINSGIHQAVKAYMKISDAVDFVA